MSLFKRFLYYFGGFSIGLVLLFFFLGGKKTSCDYGPTARTLKSIRSKERVVAAEVMEVLQKNSLDTSALTGLLRDGNVLFSESSTHLDSCKVYVIEGTVLEKNLKLSVENCEKKAYYRTLLVVVR